MPEKLVKVTIATCEGMYNLEKSEQLLLKVTVVCLTSL